MTSQQTVLDDLRAHGPSVIADISGIEGYDLTSCTNRLRQNGRIVRTGRRRDGSTIWAVKS